MVYVIEVMVYVLLLEGVYKEIFCVFKFGGVFGVYEWFMIEKFDNDDFEYCCICLYIEEGDGIV